MTESAPDLSSPPAQAFLRGVLESILALTGCETGAVVLGSTVIVDPHRPLPPEWQQAITALASEPEVAYVWMRGPAGPAWFHSGDVAAAGGRGRTPLVTLICVGAGGETSLRGRGRILDGVARTLEVVLASMAGVEGTGTQH